VNTIAWIWQVFFRPLRPGPLYGKRLLTAFFVFMFFGLALVLLLFGVDLTDPQSAANRPGGIGDWAVWIATRAGYLFIVLMAAGLGAGCLAGGTLNLGKARLLSGAGLVLLGAIILYFVGIAVRAMLTEGL
jgi:hypothetical protein